jgi:methanogenic corrinoid protein MtbC1
MDISKTNPDQKRHPIQVVSRRLGLSIDVLRVWEKRYELVKPGRSEGGHRLYSDSDIERLRLIREAMAGGRRVGQLADLTEEQLSALIEEDRRESVVPATLADEQYSHGRPDTFVTDCLVAVRALDSSSLKATIDRAVIALPPEEFIDSVATPLMHKIGDLWHSGQLNPGHEHLASSVMRNTLAEMTAALQPENAGLRFVVSTPSGQRHEIGAVLVTATAELEGWAVTYLGPDLPASDIALAAEQANADVVALSITVTPENEQLANELDLLRRSMPGGVTILIGGQASEPLKETIESIGAKYMADLSQIRETLREIASSAKGND